MGGRSNRRSVTVAAAVSGALRALAVCTPELFVLPMAQAQAFEPGTLTADIPAQPLDQALAALVRQTGLQLAYISGIVRDQRSHTVAAGLTANEALARLIVGTGLRFEYLTPRSVRILADSMGPPREPMTKIATGEELQEVIVTANRREENLQNVPITIQVLSGETLSQLSATTFDDLVRYLPAVTAHGVGPSQNSIYMRGLGTGEFANQAAGTNGSFPNVAIYLDEQSAQLPSRNLDIYAADLDRVEVLEGPQGTLFGAGAQAGVIRYITNKPKLNLTEASVSADYATTTHGDPSSALQAMINVSIIPNRLALRGVIYNEKRGGYIDNIPATFVRANTDPSIFYAHYPVPASGVCPDGKTTTTGYCVPPGSPVPTNGPVVGDHVNQVTYSGMRVQGLYQVNDAWSALIAQSYQNMDASGVFAEAAADSFGTAQPDLTAQLYNPSYDRDRFENTALTIEGRIANLKMIYAGAYLVRNVEQVQDYTSYAHRGFYVDYYQCVNPGPTAVTAQCFTPSSTWRNVERNTHLSQELRLSTPEGNRARGTGGLFYDNYKIQDQGDWYYLTALPFFNPVGPPTGYYAINGRQVPYSESQNAQFVPYPVASNNPNVRPLGDGFFNDTTRGYRQKAAFASVDVQLLPQALTLTLGTRYSNIETTEVGSLAGSFGCQKLPSDPTNPCIDHNFYVNLDQKRLDLTYSGFRSRANLSWKPSEDALIYYTWSQGFRAGGFNRRFGTPGDSPLKYVPNNPPSYQEQAHEHGGWTAPVAYGPDSLTNNELGWKTLWRDQRLQWNGTLYQEEWNDAQIDAFAQRVLSGGNLNGGTYRVRGLESSVRAQISALTLEVGVAWTHSELIKEARFFWNDGTPIDFSMLKTSTKIPLTNPAGTLGSSLAGAPAFQGNLRLRYEFAFDNGHAFAQIGMAHQSSSLASTDRLSLDLQGNSVAYDLPAFTTFDAAIGASKGGWTAQVYGENLTDTRAQLFANYSLGYKAVTVNRPRTIGLRFSYKFSGD